MDIIYRDDDVSVHTDAYLFKKLHEEFIKQKKTHTCAVIMKDLWNNQAIFWYLATAPNLEIGLHGWEHKDYSLISYYELRNDLDTALKYWRENSIRMVGQAKPITTFFSPWNTESDTLKKVCEDLGLKFCNVRKGRWDGKKIKSFHWWNSMDDKWDVKNYFK